MKTKVASGSNHPKNILFCSPTASDESTDEEAAASQKSQSDEEFYHGNVHHEDVRPPLRKAPVRKTSMFSEWKSISDSAETLSAIVRIQKVYRGHLGREILRWLVYEFQRDNLDSSTDERLSESCLTSAGSEFHDNRSIWQNTSAVGGKPMTCEVMIISSQKNALVVDSRPRSALSSSNLRLEGIPNECKFDIIRSCGRTFDWRMFLSFEALSTSAGSITAELLEARMLRCRDTGRPPNPYCKISLHHSASESVGPFISSPSLSHMNALHLIQPQYRTKTVDSCDSPLWNERISLNQAYSASSGQDARGLSQERARLGALLTRPVCLLVTIHDDGCSKSHNLLGQVLVGDWKPGTSIERWCPLYNQCGKLQLNQMGNISAIKLKLIDYRQNNQWLADLTAASERLQAAVRATIASHDFRLTLEYMIMHNKEAENVDSDSPICQCDLSARFCSAALRGLRTRASIGLGERGGTRFADEYLQQQMRGIRSSESIAPKSTAPGNLEEAEAIASLGFELASSGQRDQAQKYFHHAFDILQKLDDSVNSQRRRQLISDILPFINDRSSLPVANDVNEERINSHFLSSTKSVETLQGSAPNPSLHHRNRVSTQTGLINVPIIRFPAQDRRIPDNNRNPAPSASRFEASSSILNKFPHSPPAVEHGGDGHSPLESLDTVSRLILACEEFGKPKRHSIHRGAAPNNHTSAPNSHTSMNLKVDRFAKRTKGSGSRHLSSSLPAPDALHLDRGSMRRHEQGSQRRRSTQMDRLRTLTCGIMTKPEVLSTTNRTSITPADVDDSWTGSSLSPEAAFSVASTRSCSARDAQDLDDQENILAPRGNGGGRANASGRESMKVVPNARDAQDLEDQENAVAPRDVCGGRAHGRRESMINMKVAPMDSVGGQAHGRENMNVVPNRDSAGGGQAHVRARRETVNRLMYLEAALQLLDSKDEL